MEALVAPSLKKLQGGHGYNTRKRIQFGLSFRSFSGYFAKFSNPRNMRGKMCDNIQDRSAGVVVGEKSGRQIVGASIVSVFDHGESEKAT
jgi:hypothetical protein